MTAPSVTIRDANVDDLPVMRTLFAELGYIVDVATLAERFERFSAHGERALVAELAGQVIGLATLHMTPVLHRAGGVGRVTALVVTETVRSTGTGSALMRAAEQIMTDAGCVLMEVTSNRKRLDAHRFYERIGYEATSFRFGKPLTP